MGLLLGIIIDSEMNIAAGFPLKAAFYGKWPAVPRQWDPPGSKKRSVHNHQILTAPILPPPHL
eukprot:370740-Pelagomonas_calceolata.AAC.2